MTIFRNLSFRGKEKYKEIKELLEILEFLRKEEEAKQASKLYKLRSFFGAKKSNFTKDKAHVDLVIASDLYTLYYTEDKNLIGQLVKDWYEKYPSLFQFLPDCKRFIDTYYPDITHTYDLASNKSIPDHIKYQLKLDGIDIDRLLAPKKEVVAKPVPKPAPAPKQINRDLSAQFEELINMLETITKDPALDPASIDATFFKKLQFLYFASTVVVYTDFIKKICEKYKKIIAKMPDTKDFITRKYLDIRFDEPAKTTPKVEPAPKTTGQPTLDPTPTKKEEKPKPHTDPMITSEEKKDITEESSQPKMVIPDDIEPARSLATEFITKYFAELNEQLNTETLTREAIEKWDTKIAAQIYAMPIMINHLSCLVFLNNICEQYKDLLDLLPATQFTMGLINNDEFASNIPNSFGYQFSPTSDGGVKMSVYIPSDDDSTDDSSPA